MKWGTVWNVAGPLTPSGNLSGACTRIFGTSQEPAPEPCEECPSLTILVKSGPIGGCCPGYMAMPRILWPMIFSSAQGLFGFNIPRTIPSIYPQRPLAFVSSSSQIVLFGMPLLLCSLACMCNSQIRYFKAQRRCSIISRTRCRGD